MSLGGPYPLVSEANIFQQFANEGVLSIAAAGNDGTNDYSYPASYDGVISVGAVDQDKNHAFFSNSNDRVNLVAPGVGVWSTLPINGNCEICMALGTDQGFAPLDGTSQAAPHVAGVAALLWSRFPAASFDDVKSALFESAEDLGARGRDDDHGHGLVRAMAALEKLNGGPLAGAPLVSEDGVVCSSDEILITVDIQTDLYANETFWIISRDVDNFTVLSGAGFDNLEDYTVSRCLPANCYSFTIFDSGGDG
jgi:subtilisin family serine protease